MVSTTDKPTDEQPTEQYDAKWYLKDLNKYAAVFLAILVMYVSITAYQYTFGSATGLDSTYPLFESYWIKLFYIGVVFQLILIAALVYYFWQHRDLHLDRITPHEELRRYLNLTMWISIYTFSVYWACSYFAEQDNAWHRATIRDNIFTASHVVEFYLCFAFYTIMGISSWFYARTQLPLNAKSIFLPLTLAAAGPFMIFVAVGFNEWGHTFWFREELFGAYMYYAFVIGLWFALAVGGILLQCIVRMAELIDLIHNGSADQH
ncbi:MAG: methane monooxygenase/ammonia monooxygenase subunit C [Nitrospinales bacterium]